MGIIKVGCQLFLFSPSPCLVSTFRMNANEDFLGLFFPLFLNSAPTEGLMERAGGGGRKRKGGGDEHFWFVCFPLTPMLKCSDCKGRRVKADDAFGFLA